MTSVWSISVRRADPDRVHIPADEQLLKDANLTEGPGPFLNTRVLGVESVAPLGACDIGQRNFRQDVNSRHIPRTRRRLYRLGDRPYQGHLVDSRRPGLSPTVVGNWQLIIDYLLLIIVCAPSTEFTLSVAAWV